MDNTSLEIKLKSLDLEQNPIFKKKDHIKYIQDWRGQYKGDAAAILKPVNTKEVSHILKFANENKISVIPQGGNTSLCGAATPDNSGKSIVISLEKMNKIRQFNKKSQTIIEEADSQKIRLPLYVN